MALPTPSTTALPRLTFRSEREVKVIENHFVTIAGHELALFDLAETLQKVDDEEVVVTNITMANALLYVGALSHSGTRGLTGAELGPNGPELRRLLEERMEAIRNDTVETPDNEPATRAPRNMRIDQTDV